MFDAYGFCKTPSLVSTNQSVCAVAIDGPQGSHAVPWGPGSLQPDVLLLVIFAVTLWLLGVVSGLLLPLAFQKGSDLWQQSTTAADDSVSDDSAAHQPGLQSRPLSDVDQDEVYDEELLGGGHHGHLHHLLEPTGAGVSPHWHLSELDLHRFKTVEPVKGRLLTGDLGPGWNFIMEKEQPGRMRYASYWRPTPEGKTDYLSITIVNGTTAQEMQEFTFDDASRVAWDPMLRSAWHLQSGKDVEHSCEQLVVWLRSFPMGFVSDRLYAGITRREFSDPSQPGCLWGVSKVVHTPTTAAWAALNHPGVTLTDDYYSAWECRTILSPWSDAASDTAAEPQPACALILFHHDDLKVPEYLARTAIKLGMWKFVQGMVGYADKWMQQRRARVDPFQPDPLAACRQPAPPLSPDVVAAAATVAPRHAPSSAQLQLPETGDVEGPTTPAAPAALRKGLSNSPHSSWAGFKGFDLQEQQQQPHTPRVLYPVPTAPAPLHLMALNAAEGGGGGGGGGMGGLRRGHSLEWEPRVQSSSNGSVIVLDEPKQQGAAAVGSSNGESVQPPQHVWQRVLHASAGVSRWGGEVVGAAAGAVRGGVLQVVHAPGTAASWCWGVIRGQQGSAQQGSLSGSDGKLGDEGVGAVGVQSRGVKQGAVRLLAPAGPDGEDAVGADSASGLALQQTAAAAAAAAAAVQQQSGGFHTGVSTDFGGRSSGQGRHVSLGKRLQKLLLAAGVAALVGAGVAAHNRGNHSHSGAKQQQVVQQSGHERGQKGKGLKPGLYVHAVVCAQKLDGLSV